MFDDFSLTFTSTSHQKKRQGKESGSFICKSVPSVFFQVPLLNPLFLYYYYPHYYYTALLTLLGIPFFSQSCVAVNTSELFFRTLVAEFFFLRLLHEFYVVCYKQVKQFQSGGITLPHQQNTGLLVIVSKSILIKGNAMLQQACPRIKKKTVPSCVCMRFVKGERDSLTRSLVSSEILELSACRCR